MNQRKLKDNTNKNKIYKGSLDCLAKVNKENSDSKTSFINFF